MSEGIKTEQVYIWMDSKDVVSAKARMYVSGLGAVEIEHALSDDLKKAIILETETALRVKMGQVIPTQGDK